MQLDKDFREFAASFIDNGVRFLIVGGYALAAHGAPRYTGDLDAWVLVEPGNADRIVRALNAFGFGGLGLTSADFSSHDVVVQLGYPPHRIDILTSIDGVKFDDAWLSRMTVIADGLEIPFIGRDHLLANKRSAGRPQDLADVAALEQGSQADENLQ